MKRNMTVIPVALVIAMTMISGVKAEEIPMVPSEVVPELTPAELLEDTDSIDNTETDECVDEVEENLEEETEEELEEEKTEEVLIECEEVPVPEVVLPTIPKYSKEDVELLAKLIWHEANAQPREGKIAVGEVIVNRIESDLYPSTVKDVIYQTGQFSHSRGIATATPDEETMEIAEDVLNNDLRVLNNPAILNFRNPMKTSKVAASVEKNWGKLQYATYYGDHAFYIHPLAVPVDEGLESEEVLVEKWDESAESEQEI